MKKSLKHLPINHKLTILAYLLAATFGLFCASVTDAAAQDEPKKRLIEKVKDSRAMAVADSVDRILTTRYYRSSYDTNYVVRPVGRLTFKVRVNESGDDLHFKGTINGLKSRADLHTLHKTTISFTASYRGISGSFAINPAKMRGSYTDYEFSFSYYSSRFSVDATYHRSSTLSGDIVNGEYTGHLQSNDLNLKVANLAAYYVFNYRRFSYPAAFTQSYLQRRSAGSWLLGLSYQGGSIVTRDELKERSTTAPDIQLKIGHLGVGGGYGYNFVLGKRSNWLIHASMTPTLVIYNHNKMTVNGTPKEAEHIRFNMIFNERAAIVWNFLPRYFASITFNMTNSIFDDNVVVMNQNKWRVRAAVGVRLF